MFFRGAIKVKWLLIALLFLVVSTPFYLSDNTGRSYLDLKDFQDPATVINGYQRLFAQLRAGSVQGKAKPLMQRWVDEKGIVHFADANSKGVPENAVYVDLSKIRNTNFIAMHGSGSTGKALIVYGVLVVLLLIGLRIAWQLFKGAGRRVLEATSAAKPSSKTYTAIDFKRTDTSYTVLGVSEDASAEEIKRAYRQKMSQFHPDKVANMSESVRNRALEQAQLINAAYKSLTDQSRLKL